jgi:hypothetical protein
MIQRTAFNLASHEKTVLSHCDNPQLGERMQ